MNICPTMAESFEMLLQRHIMPINVMDQWQGFRDNLMYNVQCNDVFEANLEQTKAIFNIYTRGYLKFITFDNVKELFMKKSNLNLSLKDVTFCFGMSKITVINELDKKESVLYD